MIGTVRDHKGQRYECVAVVPHIRRDRERSEIAVWEASCAQCGEPFHFKAPAKKETFSPSRRCFEHRSTGWRVTDRELAEAARKVEVRQAKEQRKAEEARRVEEQRLAEERRAAEEARLVEERRLSKREQWRERKSRATQASEVFAVGDRVAHATKGLGIVVALDGDRVKVNFDDYGELNGPFSKLDRQFSAFNGDRVSHAKFGQGTVTARDGNKLAVEFDTSGRRMVLASFVTWVD